eukprot:TRINITY_DN12484_c0_g1_i2.p1 TRINITY_DN12484_c0_g1~~TRINITY_DN12484_c0_g1_i2.p1  ORF type:complete len:405 (+),score=94.42 TRINITY_DN12484_c0_g1_i2:57-1271(+)
MSLYEGLGLGGGEEKDPKVDQGWDIGKSMIATQLKRKKLLDESKKQAAGAPTGAKPKARLGFMPAALRQNAAPKPATSTAKPSIAKLPGITTAAISTAAIAASSTNSDEPFFDTAQSKRDILQPYDPRKPNDFEEVRIFMEQRKREQDDMAEMMDEREDDKPQRAAIAPPSQLMESSSAAIPPPQHLQQSQPALTSKTQTLDESAKRAVLGLSGDDAFAQRQAMSANSGEEAFQRRQAMSQAQSGEDAFKRRQQMSQEPSVASKLMHKMGWNQGSGLGKEGQGIRTALKVDVTQPGMGRVVTGSAPTNVLLLKNLVGPGEVDADLQPETAEECRKYGAVINCLVFECPRGTVPDHEAVRTFVQFEKVESATRAFTDMNGRFFGGRQVQAEYFSPEKFKRFELAP